MEVTEVIRGTSLADKSTDVDPVRRGLMTAMGRVGVVAFATNWQMIVRDMNAERVAIALAVRTDVSIAGAVTLDRGKAVLLEMTESSTSPTSSTGHLNVEPRLSHPIRNP